MYSRLPAHLLIAASVLSLSVACGKKAQESPAATAESPSGAAVVAQSEQPAASPADCKPGFAWKEGRCEDVDECGFVADVCGTPLAKCENTPGSYTCICPRGYAGGGPLGIACAPRVVSGVSASCALPESGGVLCWGAKNAGTIHQDYPQFVSHKPAPIDFADGAVALAFGLDHACILRQDGSVGCWGPNTYGQLGNKVEAARLIPHTVPGLTDVVQIAAFGGTTCAVQRHGALWCWGANGDGQFARIHREKFFTPQRVEVGHVIQLALGVAHACALRADGTVTCWGSNVRGEMGNGAPDRFDKVYPPTEPAGLHDVRVLAERAALLRDGSVVFWGEDDVDKRITYFEELEGVVYRKPTLIPEMAGAVGLGTWGFRTCALTPRGRVLCRGAGALGDGKVRSSSKPVEVVGGSHVLALSPNGCCFLDAERGVLCWGSNDYLHKGQSNRRFIRRPSVVAGATVLSP
jgi:hypothetical protein